GVSIDSWPAQLHYNLQTIAGSQIQRVEELTRSAVFQELRQSCPSVVGQTVNGLQLHVQIGAQPVPLGRLLQRSNQSDCGVTGIARYQGLVGCETCPEEKRSNPNAIAPHEREKNAKRKTEPDRGRVDAWT